MPLNTLDYPTLNRKISDIEKIVSQVELFIVGQPISSIRIKDLAITNAKIANLSVTNAKFANLAITNAKITSVDAAKFDAGTINADRIAAASITADKLDVTELSAISADIGTITAGTITSVVITGGTVRTASSGTRAEMTASPNAFRIFDSSTEKIRIDPDGLTLNDLPFEFVNSAGDQFKIRFYEESGEIIFEAYNADSLNIINLTSGGDLQFVAADGDIYLSGTVKVNGTTKTAIVPVKDEYRALYCIESPGVWFFDFAKSLDKIDPLFLETVEGEQNILKTDQGEYLIFSHRKGFKDTRFESKTLEQFNKNNNFWGSYGIK